MPSVIRVSVVAPKKQLKKTYRTNDTSFPEWAELAEKNETGLIQKTFIFSKNVSLRLLHRDHGVYTQREQACIAGLFIRTIFENEKHLLF